MSPFARDGHLHDLGVEQRVAGDLAPVEHEQVSAHLDGCADCARRVAAARSDDSLAPPVRIPRPANRGWWGVAAAGVALAAAVVVAVLAPPSDFTAKGSGLAVAVYLDRGAHSVRLDWNAAVRGGDRLGFRVRSSRAGQVLIVGVDSTGEVYPCWPASGEAAAVEASGEPRDLEAAIRLDPTPGAERIVAIRCPDPFSLEAIAGELAERASSVGPDEPVPELRAGCVQDELRLVKESR